MVCPAFLRSDACGDQGHWEGDDAQRLFLLSRLLDAVAPEYLDIELDRQSSADWTQLARRQEDRGGYVIRSYHGSVVDHAEIAALMARLATNPHEIPKLAIEPTGLSDTTALLRAAREFRRRMPGRTAVWIAMGEYGLPSRAGSGALRVGVELLLRSRRPAGCSGAGVSAAFGGNVPSRRGDGGLAGAGGGRRTGRPFEVARVPQSSAARGRGVGGVTFPSAPTCLVSSWSFADEAGIRGASVTVPHKESALALATGEAGGRGVRTRAEDGCGQHAGPPGGERVVGRQHRR